MNLVDRAAEGRRAVLAELDSTTQASHGQYFTPAAVAELMAELPVLPRSGELRVLDPGAGSGMLTAALTQRLRFTHPDLRLDITAVEADIALLPSLRRTMADCEKVGATTRIITADYIEWALTSGESFDLIIQNPPYRKLRAKSSTDVTLRRAGIIVPNLYAAFMALGALQLTPGGQQVSITPRSWMNGPYYQPFRRLLLRTTSIDTIHTFESRSLVFGDMGVLQESIIVHLTAGKTQGSVRLRSSLDQNDKIAERTVPGHHVVTPDFIFVPASPADAAAVAWMAKIDHSLADLDLKVSTGRVVDFRSRELLRTYPTSIDAPMVYPGNITQGTVIHPRTQLSKPQWFDPVPDGASRLLVPAGTYVIIKRFSAKEERRRIVAAVWSDDRPAAFDNKLNYIHQNGHGMDPMLAQGLAVWLNSTPVDSYFRVFSGHTQVNASDLRQMKFPSLEQLLALSTANTDPDEAVCQLIGARMAAA